MELGAGDALGRGGLPFGHTNYIPYKESSDVLLDVEKRGKGQRCG
jgi:hypothetical protein